MHTSLQLLRYKEDCSICQELSNWDGSWFYSNIGIKIGRKNRILMQTDRCVVVPTVGCLVPGYVLVFCKDHYLSMANLPDDLFSELIQLKRQIEERLYRYFGSRCICFEHGTSDATTSGANSIEHIHFHIIPFSRPIWKEICPNIQVSEVKEFFDYNSLRKEWKKSSPKAYLTFQDIDQKIYYIPNAIGLPSQLFRKLLSPLLGAEEWDWRKESYEGNMIRTINLFDCE